MLAPDQGFFVDGNPNGGTIVAAAFMNAVLGEIQAILALEQISLLTSGTQPEDHSQVASALSASWVRIRETGLYPQNAAPNSVLIDPALLLQGEWPFRIRVDEAWETPPTPLGGNGSGSGNNLAEGEDSEAITVFNDVVHGQRGGGGLHSLATAESAGFLSPAGYRLLVSLSEDYPQRLIGSWQPVEAENTYLVEHGLQGLPEIIQVWFRESGEAPRRLVNTFFNPQQRFCGYSVSQSNAETITLVTGDRVWAGYTNNGFQEFSSGEYSVQVLKHG